ncbi:MAG: hypothetical protein LC795_01805 [Acidobacteria bacterium]|nr:hypothetical protein [Acidobacteriota bacterium]
MRPEQLEDFKRELAALPGELGRDEVIARVESLYERYELPDYVLRTDGQRRRCKAPVLPIASSAPSSELHASRYKTYTGGTAYLLSGASIKVGWCPEVNALLCHWESWTEEDSYLRIPGGGGLYINYLSPLALASLLLERGLRCEAGGGGPAADGGAAE